MIRFVVDEEWNAVVCAVLGISQREVFRRSLPGNSHPRSVQRLREDFLQTMKSFGQKKLMPDQIAALVGNTGSCCNDKEIAEAHEWACRIVRPGRVLGRRLD